MTSWRNSFYSMDKDFKKWYRRRYEEFDIPPPAESWQNIVDKLDSAHERKRRTPLLYLSVGLLGCVFLSTFFIRTISRNILGDKFSSNNQVIKSWHLVINTEDIPQEIRRNNNFQSDHLSKTPDLKSNLAVTSESVVSAKESIEKHAGVKIKEETNQSHQSVNGSLVIRDNDETNSSTFELSRRRILVSTDVPVKTMTVSVLPIAVDSSPVTRTTRRFYLGTTIDYGNSWVVNANLWDAANRSSLSYVVPYYSASAGLFAGFSIRQRKDLFIELGNRTSGQKYYTFEEGHSNQYNLELRYMHIKSYMSFKSHQGSFGKNIRTWFSLQAGLHAGYLLSAKQNRNNSVPNKVHEDYRRMDAGLLVGAAYSVAWKHLGLTLGVRSNIGVFNVYAGSDELPYGLNKTYNESVSLFSSVLYSF